MGGRGLSHLQEQPLTKTGCRRAPGKTGACGQLGSRTADRMAVPQRPSIRERACPARLGPARTANPIEENGGCMDVYCGIDWAEDHHDIALADRDGNLLARRRISDDAAGLTVLLALLAEHGDTPDDPVPVAIETPRGLLVACLRATGRQVYPINPMSVARYRDRHSVAGRKSDHGDCIVLAGVLRTDMHAHRPLPAAASPGPRPAPCWPPPLLRPTPRNSP